MGGLDSPIARLAQHAVMTAIENKYAGDAESEMGALTIEKAHRISQVTLAVMQYITRHPGDEDMLFADTVFEHYPGFQDAEECVEWMVTGS